MSNFSHIVHRTIGQLYHFNEKNNKQETAWLELVSPLRGSKRMMIMNIIERVGVWLWLAPTSGLASFLHPTTPYDPLALASHTLYVQSDAR